MFCPGCLEEYPWHVRICPRCEVDLVERLPGPPPGPELELVPVFTSGDAGVISLARSLLEAEAIEYLVRGENLQDLFGCGRIGGFNVVVGPAEFVVRAEDADRARELLEELQAGQDSSVQAPEDDV